MIIEIVFNHSSGYTVRELGYFDKIEGDTLFWFGDIPSKGKPSWNLTMKLEKILSIRELVHK